MSSSSYQISIYAEPTDPESSGASFVHDGPVFGSANLAIYEIARLCRLAGWDDSPSESITPYESIKRERAWR